MSVRFGFVVQIFLLDPYQLRDSFDNPTYYSDFIFGYIAVFGSELCVGVTTHIKLYFI